jgi:predicted DNA-binding protein
VIPEKKSDEKVRRNFYVNKGLDKELNKLARKTGNSKSELVDIAIEFLINNYRTE